MAAGALQSKTGGQKTFSSILSTPKHPICNAIKDGSTHKGEPAILYTHSEIRDLSSHLQLTLIGKFDSERPSMEYLRRGFKTIGFQGAFFIGLLDDQHVLIQFDQADDYNRCWLHRIWKFGNYKMRILKWTPTFHIDEEPPFAPVWISLEGLPLFLFSKGPLFSIASLIGNPLKLDAATEHVTRPSVARICVEINVLNPLPRRIWIGHGDSGFWQSITYDQLPSYCTNCNRFGHLGGKCLQEPSAPLHVVPNRPPVGTKRVWQKRETTTNTLRQDDISVGHLNLVAQPVTEETGPNVSPTTLANPCIPTVCQNTQEISNHTMEACTIPAAPTPTAVCTPTVITTDIPGGSGLSVTEKAVIPTSVPQVKDVAIPHATPEGIHAVSEHTERVLPLDLGPNADIAPAKSQNTEQPLVDDYISEENDATAVLVLSVGIPPDSIIVEEPSISPRRTNVEPFVESAAGNVSFRPAAVEFAPKSVDGPSFVTLQEKSIHAPHKLNIDATEWHPQNRKLPPSFGPLFEFKAPDDDHGSWRTADSAEEEEEEEVNEEDSMDDFLDSKFIRDDLYLVKRKNRESQRERDLVQFRRGRGRPPGSLNRTYSDIVHPMSTRSKMAE